MTRGYARPSSLVDSADIFARVLPPFEQENRVGKFAHRQRHALVVGLEVDKSRIAMLILVLAFLGSLTGIVVALVARDPCLGAEIGAAAFAFVAVLQGAMVLMYR